MMMGMRMMGMLMERDGDGDGNWDGLRAVMAKRNWGVNAVPHK